MLGSLAVAVSASAHTPSLQKEKANCAGNTQLWEIVWYFGYPHNSFNTYQPMYQSPPSSTWWDYGPASYDYAGVRDVGSGNPVGTSTCWMVRGEDGSSSLDSMSITINLSTCRDPY